MKSGKRCPYIHILPGRRGLYSFSMFHESEHEKVIGLDLFISPAEMGISFITWLEAMGG